MYFFKFLDCLKFIMFSSGTSIRLIFSFFLYLFLSCVCFYVEVSKAVVWMANITCKIINVVLFWYNHAEVEALAPNLFFRSDANLVSSMLSDVSINDATS